MIVVTGSAGQVGNELVKVLKKKGIKFRGFNKKELDVTDRKSIQKNLNQIKNISIIINLAAYTNVEKAEEEKKINDKINYYGVKNLCNYIKSRNILFINISTDYVFDGKKKDRYIETDTTNPLNNYGLSKKKAEDHIKKNISKHIILRTSWVFSKKKSSFFNFIDSSIKKKIYLINDIYGNPTSSKSLSLAILKVIITYNKNNKLKYGTYHFCNYPITNWKNFGIFYSKIKNYNLKNIYEIKSLDLKQNAIRPKNSSLSSEKFEKTFKFKRIYWKNEIRSFR